MNFRYRLMQFMSGRYGVDQTFYILFGIAAVLSVVNCFARLWVLQMIVYAVVIYALFRVLSRNQEARLRENRVIGAAWNNLRRRWQTWRQRSADRAHVYRKCPGCRAVLRLPRRKGKHSTVCPKCGRKFTVRVLRDCTWDVR